jgi:hypothetical protein
VINPAGLNYNLVPIFSFVMLGPSFFENHKLVPSR